MLEDCTLRWFKEKDGSASKKKPILIDKGVRLTKKIAKPYTELELVAEGKAKRKINLRSTDGKAVEHFAKSLIKAGAISGELVVTDENQVDLQNQPQGFIPSVPQTDEDRELLVDVLGLQRSIFELLISFTEGQLPERLSEKSNIEKM